MSKKKSLNNPVLDSAKYYNQRVLREADNIRRLKEANYIVAANSRNDTLKKYQNEEQAYLNRQKTKKLSELTDAERSKMEGMSIKKKGGIVSKRVNVSAGGEKHVVYKKTNKIGKGKPGDIMVNHPTKDKGKWDTINLTKIGKAKTVAQGVAVTKKWHKDNPDYKYKKRK